MTAPKVLVIDDDADARSAIELALKTRGYELFFATDGADGLDIFRRESPIVTLLDLRMPVMDGTAFLKAVCPSPESPYAIIMLTGHADDSEVEVCYKLGIHAFLRKPFNIYELNGAIEQNIKLKQAQISLQQLNKKLDKLATFDTLTGLYNRAMLVEHLQQAIRRASRSRQSFGLFYFDIDNFKKVNDACGHSVGDELLQQVSKRVGQLIRSSDILARMGGDEFVLLTEGMQKSADLATMAGDILREIAAEIYIGRQPVHVSCSIGISVYPDCGSTPEELIKTADMAMYKAKDAGRNCYKFYSAKMNAAVSAQLTMENNIKQALKRGEFSIHYQPKVDHQAGTVSGAEALIRWHHPKLGNISPAEFIPVAEKSDLIVEIGKWVREQVCRQLARWRQQSLPLLPVSVNVSAIEFLKCEVLQHVIDLLLQHDIDPHLLELEVTESTLMASVEQGNMDYEIITLMDTGLAIDDFGTGYSSLGYLKSYPVDTLKIDKSFIDNVTASERDAAIVKAMISMAHSLDIRVVAEGVETAAQRDFLHRHGCDFIQGYFYSRPLPVAEFEAFVREFRGRPAVRCG